tara:strand:+ start:8233 stop:9912 length:1680 start_codon:yes stop_codon:yes gene_type:complete
VPNTKKINIHQNPFLKTLLISFTFFLLFYIVLIFRGEGWDGDSLVNIAQFNKLVSKNLYGVPDSGTTPKLFTIFIFGLFNFIFNSYSIHIPTILLMSYALAKVAQLPRSEGGGYIWLFLPFISPILIFSTISADNPSLAIAFYILHISFLLEKKILLSFVFLLFAEFSRPGYSVLMLLSICFLIFNNSINLTKDKNKIIIIFFLILLGFAHSFFLYKLAYPTFENYNLNNWDTYRAGNHKSSEFYINNKIFTLNVIFNSFLTSIFSNNTLPFPLSIFGIIVLLIILLVNKFKNNFSILFLQPVIYSPFIYAALTKGTIMADYRNPYFFKNIYASDPYYFITLVPILLFGISYFIGNILNIEIKDYSNNFLKFIKSIFFERFLSKIFKSFYNLKFAIILAIILAIGNGLILKTRYEFNPLQSNSVKSKFSDIWLSDPIAKEKFYQIYLDKGKKINVLTTCDVIPILVDNALYIEKISFASPHIYLNKKKVEYIGSCYESHFLKRSDDVLLNKDEKYDFSDNFDLLYTTKDMVKYFQIDKRFKIIELKINRVIVINSNNYN